ncbi:type II toxin-antitoxin system RelE/ParE family toxin [Thermoanaerobacterium thermosaccharolyticum]|nr:type II toxin-antitoxin system RelE/ParE family toxin [Thermoanaerobacterium thermosaccharolyticum]MBE0068799.1 type II toxin-antitoxin system RelE/ParE family toxin [Thermoanaerobacterium thermosaccharolyticum]MBE0227132.1 type II toxin-antitoxin system RelE/ParE family toxin [Thermoanaerobacterium thermosaccharolyticum]
MRTCLKMYKIQLSKEAVKCIEKYNKKTKERIKNCIERISLSPYGGKNIKKLKGMSCQLYRYRLGDIRIIYTIKEEKALVIVVTVGNRGDVYKKY